jgi:polar amino acid transport system substrate-binding protein
MKKEEITMIQRFAAVAAAILLCASPVLAPASWAQEGKPLRTAVDGSFPPHAFPNPAGGTQGFNIDLFTEVAKRMKRPITIDAVSFSTLIPGMAAGRYDFVAAPTTVTKERAENMLFTAGYLWTYFQFGIKKGSKPLTDWADLKGKVLAVNKGTPYETVGKTNAAKYGFEVQAFDYQTDAVQAVLSGRAYATFVGNTSIAYIAKQNPMFVPDLALKAERLHWAAAFPKDNPKLRNEMQDVLDCMKKDGTIVKLYEKWIGPSEPDGLERTITPGYGVPDMPGYDPTPHELKCG